MDASPRQSGRLTSQKTIDNCPTKAGMNRGKHIGPTLNGTKTDSHQDNGAGGRIPPACLHLNWSPNWGFAHAVHLPPALCPRNKTS